jgi:cobalt-precorrin-5B (C1)-methyltransferase
MNDPVTGFVYPEAWVAACTSPEARALAESGFGVLTADGTVRRRGLSTGTTAAAAAKAAVLSLEHPVDLVEVHLPCGLLSTLFVTADRGRACCHKDPGDYPGDTTADACIEATAVPAPSTVVVAGGGIGRYVRDTPRFTRGSPAISAPAMETILGAIRDATLELALPGAEVTLSVRDGAAIAERTLNARVGIEGGISLLGTTGLVEPWDDHLTESVLVRIAAADRVVLTTGRIGLAHARRHFPDAEVVLVGGRIKEALAASAGTPILFGLPALILKYLCPDLLDGTGCFTVEELAATPRFTGAVEQAFRVASRDYPGLRLVVIDRSGTIIAEGP